MQPQYITLKGRALDITNQRFGRLLVLGPIGRSKNNCIVWSCQCDCGNTIFIPVSYLRSGDTKSCGCLRSETTVNRLTIHALAQHPLYRIWSGIIQRCTNPNNPAYGRYGAVGISVHSKWRHDFQIFYDCVSTLPHCGEQGYSIDRIDNDGSYIPGNIKWSTRTEQARNRQSNRLVTYDGRTQPLAAWAEEYNLAYTTLWDRLRYGWSIEEALTKPRYCHRR